MQIVERMRTIKRERKLKWNKASYRNLVTFKLPRRSLRDGRVKVSRSRKVEAARNSFPVKVLQKEGDKVKVHYVGYDKRYDEWKNQCDIEMITEDMVSQPESIQIEREADIDNSVVYKPYSVYKDLIVRIKKSIVCSRNALPKVKIIIPFDLLMFNGGMKMAGRPVKKIGRVQYYKLDNYQDLNHLLGKNWHVRGLNG